MTATDHKIIEQACRQLAASPGNQPRMEALAAQAGWTASTFSRRFKQVVGVSPREFAGAHKMQAFRDALSAGANVTDALHDAGFGSTSRLYEKTDRDLGMTPSAFAKGGAGEVMHYATAETAVGWVVMAATARGICSVQFAASRKTAVQSLADRFPNAERIPSPDSPDLQSCIEQLQDFLAKPGALPDLPLDLRGTAFQRKVWRYLQAIPTGETRSYAQVATDIGHPKAVRAVGTACGNNRVAVLVPCHRVLRGDGTLGGYRWGLDTKRELLQRESGEVQHA